MSNLRVGNVNVKIVLTIKDNDSIVDISSSEEKKIIIRKPDGKSYTKDAQFLTNGIDGKILYYTVKEDFPVAGLYKVQGSVIVDGKTYHTSIEHIRIQLSLDNIETYDEDAFDYLTTIEEIDGENLEDEVKDIVINFILGCKLDGIWDDLENVGIIAGARTLNASLFPLKGGSVTNNNFVSGDYDRKTGLKSDGSTKYIDLNIKPSKFEQNNVHAGIYTNSPEINPFSMFFGGGYNFFIANDFTNNTLFNLNQSSSSLKNERVNPGTFVGMNRSSNNQISYRVNNSTNTASSISIPPDNTNNINLFSFLNGLLIANTRIGFYSFGKSTNLEKLDIRSSLLMSQINRLSL